MQQVTGGVGSLRDIWSSLNDVTKAINALTQEIAANQLVSTSVLTLTAPVVVSTATYAMLATNTSIIAAGTATLTLTLIAPGTVSGRLLIVKNTVAFAVNSASANVVGLTGGAASTTILASTPGKWAILQSDGVNWQIMAAN